MGSHLLRESKDELHVLDDDQPQPLDLNQPDLLTQEMMEQLFLSNREYYRQQYLSNIQTSSKYNSTRSPVKYTSAPSPVGKKQN